MVSGRGLGSIVIGSGFCSIAIIIGLTWSAFFFVSSLLFPILTCTGPGELSQQTFILQPGVRLGSIRWQSLSRYKTLKIPNNLEKIPATWSLVGHCSALSATWAPVRFYNWRNYALHNTQFGLGKLTTWAPCMENLRYRSTDQENVVFKKLWTNLPIYVFSNASSSTLHPVTHWTGCSFELT